MTLRWKMKLLLPIKMPEVIDNGVPHCFVGTDLVAMPCPFQVGDRVKHEQAEYIVAVTELTEYRPEHWAWRIVLVGMYEVPFIQAEDVLAWQEY